MGSYNISMHVSILKSINTAVLIIHVTALLHNYLKLRCSGVIKDIKMNKYIGTTDFYRLILTTVQ